MHSPELAGLLESRSDHGLASGLDHAGADEFGSMTISTFPAFSFSDQLLGPTLTLLVIGGKQLPVSMPLGKWGRRSSQFRGEAAANGEYDTSSGFQPAPPEHYTEWFRPVAAQRRGLSGVALAWSSPCGWKPPLNS